jgi:hypothetical protein
MLMMMLYWACSSLPRAKRGLLRLQAAGVGTFFVALAVFNWRNLYYFLNLRFFLSPPGSDNAQNAADAVQSLPVNLSLVLAGFAHVKSAHISGFFSEHSTHLLADVRYAVTSPVLRIFLLVGLFALLRRPRKQLHLFLLGFLGITTLAPAFSNLVVFPTVTIPTYNCFRVFFSAIPMCIIAGMGYSHLLSWASSRGKALRGAALGAFCVAIALQTASLIREKEWFVSYLHGYPCAFKTKGDGAGVYACGEVPGVTLTWENTYKALADRGLHVVYDGHIPYYRFARILDEQLDGLSLAPREVALLNLPVWRTGAMEHEHYWPYNYHQLFIALYVGDRGRRVGYIPFYSDRSASIGRPSLRSWGGIKAALATSVFDGSRKLPLPLDAERKHYLVKPGESIHGMMKNFRPGETKYLLVTTSEERDFALQYLKEHQLSGRPFEMDAATGKLVATH